MAELLGSGQIFYPRLLGIQLPGMQVKDHRTSLLVHFSHAEASVRVGKQAEVTATAEWKAPAIKFHHAHRKLVEFVSDFIGSQRRVRDAVVRMKAHGED